MVITVTRILIISIFLLSQVTYADVPAWEILKKESNITFTATQNNSPVSGKFTSFSGEIKADPNKLSESHVRIVIDLGSVTTDYAEVADTLKTSDWFNIKIFPQAIFESDKFIKTGPNSYQANGSLKIRDKTLPIILKFTQEEFSPNKARVKGSAEIKRTIYGVGQGEWSETSEVKDDVKINFVLTAVRTNKLHP